MNIDLYNMIFKRKSFHHYREMESLSSDELSLIQSCFPLLDRLYPKIITKLKIVPSSETTMKRGEYALLLFSEKKEGYLENIGYIGEQLDLFLASIDIGVCWYGAGKLKQKISTDLEFVIMLSIAKVSFESFRKDMFRSKRKDVSEIWKGDRFMEVANIVRFAPSACNVQPWYVEEKAEGLDVYLLHSERRRGIMPLMLQEYYAHIDIGIFLCFLELCLKKRCVEFERILSHLAENIDYRKSLIACYSLSHSVENS